MAATAVISTKPNSFVYEDLVSHVEKIQKEMTQMEEALHQKCQIEKNVIAELKSRSFVFIDPHGNRTVQKYLDHQSIEKILRKYKKDYVPKYLQKWIKIGSLIRNQISTLDECELKSTVSKYDDGHQFIAYVDTIALIQVGDDKRPEKILLEVLLTDNMEKIKMRIMKRRNYDNIELRIFAFDHKAKPFSKKWAESTPLKTDDTILSSQLYQNNFAILATNMQKMLEVN